MNIKRSPSHIIVWDEHIFDELPLEQQQSVLRDIDDAGIEILYTDAEMEVLLIEFKTKRIESGIVNLLNTKARAKGYDSIITASLRAALPNSPFHTEGVAFATWMDEVWAYCYQELDRIQTGLRTEPLLEDFILELPQLNLGE